VCHVILVVQWAALMRRLAPIATRLAKSVRDPKKTSAKAAIATHISAMTIYAIVIVVSEGRAIFVCHHDVRIIVKIATW